LKEKRKRRLDKRSNNPKETLEKLENRVGDSAAAENTEEDKNLFKEVLATIKELADENKFLRVLASLGLTIGEYSHEIKQYSAWFLGDIHLLEQILHEQAARDSLDSLKSHLKGFETYTDYYGIITSKNTDRKLSIIEMRDVVKPFVERIKPNSNDINLKFIPIGYDLYTCPMHPSEWGSILLNLFTNAKKAIKKANIKNGEILIKCSKENNKIIIEFYDNGIGIIEEHKGRIFNAFFTTSDTLSDNDSAKTDLMGSGLGLHIVKSIIESYEGEIYVADPIDNYKTCIRIEIPSATQIQIDKYEQN
jgi:signal transduction histidine kinase